MSLRGDKPIPMPAAIAILTSIFLGGVLLIWHYLRPAPAARVMHVTTPTLANPRMAGGPISPDNTARFNIIQAAAEAELTDGIHPGAAGDTLFKAGDTYFRVIPAEPQPRYSFGYFTVTDAEWEHGYLTQGIRRILTQEEFAKEIAISAEQRKLLEALPEAPATKWPQGDREKFITQYQAWNAASGDKKTKAGEELIQSLKKYGEEKRAADLKAISDRVTRAKAILTEKQLARINPIPKWDVKTTPATAK